MVFRHSGVMPPSRLPKDRPVASWRSSSGFGECGLPSDAVGDDVQQPPGVVHVVGVGRGDGFPGVPGRVGCRNTERRQQPVLAVGAVVGQGLAGPLAGDQDPAPGVAEVIGVVGLALAPAGRQAGPGVLGLDAVAEPVRARRRARLVPQRLGQPRRRGPAGRRCRPGGSRRPAWSGTWSGSRCTGWRPWIRRARPGRRTGPRTGPRAAARPRRRWRRAPGPRWAGLPRWPGRGSCRWPRPRPAAGRRRT